MTTLYGLQVPAGEPQILRYDDGTGEELPVPLGTTACERQTVIITEDGSSC